MSVEQQPAPPPTLTPAAINAMAERVAEILLEQLRPMAGRHVDPNQLAEVLGVSRTWVYEHADELGARRLVDGPKAPIRFDLAKTLALIDERSSRAAVAAPDDRPISGRRRQRRTTVDRDLLPIRGDRS